MDDRSQKIMAADSQTTAISHNRITICIGRHTLLALARGEAIDFQEAPVTLIHASDYPSTAIMSAIGDQHDR
jgi:hypothetical protein